MTHICYSKQQHVSYHHFHCIIISAQTTELTTDEFLRDIKEMSTVFSELRTLTVSQWSRVFSELFSELSTMFRNGRCKFYLEKIVISAIGDWHFFLHDPDGKGP